MLDITIQLHISANLTSQVTIIICYHEKKILLKKIQKYGRLNQNLYVN